MPANKGAKRKDARRPQGAVAPRSARQPARQAASRPERQPARRPARQPAPSLPQPRFTRDKLLGWGAALCALLTAAGLNLQGLVLLIGLGYTAFALLGPPDKRDWRLRQAAWAFAVLLVAAVVVAIFVTVRLSRETPDSEASLVYLSMGTASAVLAIVSEAVLALAAIMGALAFGATGSMRHRLLSWWGLGLVFYYILFLPSAVVESPAPPALGSFWAEPLAYGSITLGLLAGIVMWCAFLWTDGIDRAKREYLLFVGAASWLLPRVMGLLLFDWSRLSPDSGETLSGTAATGLFTLALLLQMPALFGFATAAFWTSCRQAGWKPSHWSAPEQVPAAWAQRFLLTWRLPLAYGWFIVLIAACSFLGWYGFVAVAPAVVHYVWMLARQRSRVQSVGPAGA